MASQIPTGVYKHYKGNLYYVVAVALHSETKEPLVVYHTHDGSTWWVRPLDMFMESVEVNGRVVPRFTFIKQ